MTYSKSLIIVGIILWAVSAIAADIDYNSLSKDGFDDVAKLLQEMTPQQRQEVMEQAAVKEKELKKMSPQELQALREQLRTVADTIDMDKIDPAKLDPAKSKSTSDIQKDLNTYQKKYNKNQIHNSVVKPVDTGQ